MVVLATPERAGIAAGIAALGALVLTGRLPWRPAPPPAPRQPKRHPAPRRSTGPTTSPGRSGAPTSTAPGPTRASSPAAPPLCPAGWRSTEGISTGATALSGRSGAPTVGQPQLRHLFVVPLRTERPGRNQRGRLQELLHLEEDPVATVPDLPVGNPAQARRDPHGDLPHHRLGISQVDAAIEMSMSRRHSTGSPLVTTSSIHHANLTPPVTRADTN